MSTFRSSTHGTCALGGRHSSEQSASECPALGANAQERLRRFRERGNTNPQGGPLISPPARISPVDFDEVSITPAPDEMATKAARGGRPRKHATAQAARREAQRAYRARAGQP